MKNTIKAERALLDLTQEELAETVGISRQTISAIERQSIMPSVEIALKLSRLFAKPVNDFFELEPSDDHC